jgi:hypothetical protein
LVWDQGVAGSNPAAPTSKQRKITVGSHCPVIFVHGPIFFDLFSVLGIIKTSPWRELVSGGRRGLKPCADSYTKPVVLIFFF